METNIKIDIYFHVFLTENYHTFSIVNEQIFLLHISELLYQCDSLNIVVVCPQGENNQYIENLKKLITKFNLNFNVIIRGIFSSGNECLTGNFLIDDCKKTEEERYILYFHTKGSSRESDMQIPTKYWRHFMEYYCIKNWKNCIIKLDSGYESVGSLWIDRDLKFNHLYSDHPHLKNKDGDGFYAGTFYWIKNSLIRKIINQKELGLDRYCMEELPALVKHKHFSFDDFPIELGVDLYREIYHPKNYIKKKYE
jgi:hypothetical protein